MRIKCQHMSHVCNMAGTKLELGKYYLLLLIYFYSQNFYLYSLGKSQEEKQVYLIISFIK